MADLNFFQQHDFVELFQDDISRIFDVCSPLYLQGHSLTEVSNLTGFAWTTVRDQLVKGGLTLRPKNSVNSSEVLRLKFKSSTPPPFGYVYLEGQLQKDQKEFPTLQIIWNQWRIGRSATNLNFDKLIPFIMTLVIGAAAIGKLDELQRWVWKSQAHLIYQSRASAWGSRSIFKDRFSNDTQKK